MRDSTNLSDGGTAGVNWRRGAFRLWVFATVIWLLSATWVQTQPTIDPNDLFADLSSPRTRHGCEAAAKVEPRVNIEACVDRAAKHNSRDLQRVAWVVLPPIGALVFGLSIWWVASGFRPRRI